MCWLQCGSHCIHVPPLGGVGVSRPDCGQEMEFDSQDAIVQISLEKQGELPCLLGLEEGGEEAIIPPSRFKPTQLLKGKGILPLSPAPFRPAWGNCLIPSRTGGVKIPLEQSTEVCDPLRKTSVNLSGPATLRWMCDLWKSRIYI